MKAELSSTWNSPNQQRGWVGPGSVLSYDLFEFALIHVAAKSKGPPEIGCSFHNCVPKEDRGYASIDHCFLETERFGSENRKKKNTKKSLPKPQGAHLFQDRLCPTFLRHKVGECALTDASVVLPGPFFFSGSLLTVFYQNFGVSIGPKSKSFTLLLFLCYYAKACQCHALIF